MISEPRCILCPPEGIPILRLHQHTNSAVAKTYYQKMVGAVLASYYQSDMDKSQPDADQLLIGRVDGKLADQLNLSGGMTEQQFHDLIDGNAVDPITGERLRKRQNRDGNNRVGVDLTFDTGGKSLSAYYARTQDPLVLELFNEARHETMERDVEPRMMVRVRKDGENYSKLTGKALWTSFPDLVTRPTKVKDEATGKWVETNTTDPHLHDHCLLLQYTYDEDYVNKDGTKGAYLSADTSKIWAAKPYIQQAFHARLFKKLRDAGFNVIQTEHGLDLAGWTDEMSDTFSRRKAEVEGWAKKKGIERLQDKAKGGKATRGGKAYSSLTMDEQFEEWRNRLPEETWDVFLKAAKDTSGGDGILPHFSPDQAIDYALAHTLERDNSATIEEVMHAALEVGMGLDVDQLQKRLLSDEKVVSAWFGNDLIVSTHDMLELERNVIERATNSQASCVPLGNPDFEFKPFDSGHGKMVELNNNQRVNIQKLLDSHARFLTLKGSPGVGKTAALGTQLFRAVEENGGRVLTLGSTSNARDQLIKFGTESGSVALQESKTLAKFLDDESLQRSVDNQTLVVLDEATLGGLRDLNDLMQMVEEKNARLLLVGDYRQMDAVQRHGKIFEQLSKLGTEASFDEIVRQRDVEYRRAATLTSGDEKEIRAGFDRFKKLGFIQEFDDRKERIEQAAKVYLDITGEKKNNRGKLLKWSLKEKRDPAMYRSGITIVRGTGAKAEKLEVVGRDGNHVMVVPLGNDPAAATPLDLTGVKQLRVYEASYRDAILVVGTHKQGEAITRKIREARRTASELGIEQRFDRLESIGLSNAERQNTDKYKAGEQIIEFARKATAEQAGTNGATRSITYGEQFTVAGRDTQGRVLMRDQQGHELIAPLELSDRFDVYRVRDDKLAVGDPIRMTKGGELLPGHGKQRGVRFSNNDVFTVKGYDAAGNILLNNDHKLSKSWQHWRSGYYKTSMSGQGSTASHNIFVDSKEAGKSRSKEAWLVSVTRGKHAATIITDDVASLRNQAILRSAQRPSAIEVATQARTQDQVEIAKEVARLETQTRRLSRIDEYARTATASTMHAIRTRRDQIVRKLKTLLPKLSKDKSKEEPLL